MKPWHILIFFATLANNLFSFSENEYYLVQHKATGNDKSSIHQLHLKAAAKVVRTYRHMPGLELIKFQPNTQLKKNLQIYQSNPHIIFIEPNYLVHAAVMPDDPVFKSQWALNNTGQTNGKYDADVNAPEAWDIEKGSRKVVVAIVDTGIDYNHSDLINNLWINPGEIPGNKIDDDNNGYIDDVHGVNTISVTGDPKDDSRHGTHVAGIIGAVGNNALGVSGVMQKVSMLACKFLNNDGEGDVATAIACLDYLIDLKTRLQNPVDILVANNSWSGGSFSKALYLAIAAMEKAGIIFAAAASNEGKNNDVTVTYPANYQLPNVVSVAATDDKDNLATYSNYGKYSVHVAAPGHQILSTFPNNAYGVLSGTSMATPMVVGLIGLLKSARPDLNWIQIRNLAITGGEIIDATVERTISDRRVRAWDFYGASILACENQRVLSLISPKNSSQVIKIGAPLTITMMSLNCLTPNHLATISISSNDVSAKGTLRLVDDGTRGDVTANDGLFTGQFVSNNAGNFRLNLTVNDRIIVKVTK